MRLTLKYMHTVLCLSCSSTSSWAEQTVQVCLRVRVSFIYGPSLGDGLGSADPRECKAPSCVLTLGYFTVFSSLYKVERLNLV